jgi:hypothetical protein
MNIVLMTSRSGSSLVCKILAAHGLTWQDGNRHPEQLPRGSAAGYPTFEHPGWKAALKKTAPGGKWPLGYLVPVTDERLKVMLYAYGSYDGPDFVKSGVEFAALWMALGTEIGIDVKFIKVRRPVEQIAASLARRGIGDAALGAEVARRRFKLMDMIEGPDVHTDVLALTGMWRRSGIREAIEQCGKTPDNILIKQQIDGKIFHE